MQYMPVTEAMFLIAETREQPMHVGGLQLFEPREGQSASDLAEEVFEVFHNGTEVSDLFRKRPASPAPIMGNLFWTHDDEIDFDYHVRRVVLPRPGRVRELLRYVSLNHGALLDRNRPMWEVHIIEGLNDGRLALYTKVHHSLVDGVTALRILQRTLSTDPEDRSGRTPWALHSKPRPATEKSDEHAGRIPLISGLLGAAGAAAGVKRAAYIPMRLPLEVAGLFREWLDVHYPDRAAKVMAIVRAIREVDGDAILVLSDETEEPLDPSTLRMGKRGDLYLRVKHDAKGGPFDAKMTRFAQTQLGPFLSEENGEVVITTLRGRMRLPAEV